MLITTDRGIPHACARDVRGQAAGRDHLSGRGTPKRKPLLRERGEASHQCGEKMEGRPLRPAAGEPR